MSLSHHLGESPLFPSPTSGFGTTVAMNDETAATASYPPATAANRALALSPCYPLRRCGCRHSACSGSRWTTCPAVPLRLGCGLRELRGTLLWRLPRRLLQSFGGGSRWVPRLCFRGFGGRFSTRAE